MNIDSLISSIHLFDYFDTNKVLRKVLYLRNLYVSKLDNPSCYIVLHFKTFYYTFYDFFRLKVDTL